MFCIICFPTAVLSETVVKESCFNFYIVTKKTSHYSEATIYKNQKELVLDKITQTQLVFDNNLERNCPEIRFTKGIIKQIPWKEAVRFSQPLDQKVDESLEAYRDRKLREASDEVQTIAKTLIENPDIKYVSFIELRPGLAIVKAERMLQEIIKKREVIMNENIQGELNGLQSMTRVAIKQVKAKLDTYTHEPKDVILKRAENILKKYEQIDQLSASSWREGILTFWNDIEAQDTSIELKNLFHSNRTPTNQCLDVYLVPSGKSPSRNNKEIQKNGDWTFRGGAALLAKYFPRTTEGGGHAIILTQDIKTSGNSLAHEFGHLLIGSNDAHLGKTPKDLMHENTMGGIYLDENECNKIRENIVPFIGGSGTSSQ